MRILLSFSLKGFLEHRFSYWGRVLWKFSWFYSRILNQSVSCFKNKFSLFHFLHICREHSFKSAQTGNQPPIFAFFFRHRAFLGFINCCMKPKECPGHAGWFCWETTWHKLGQYWQMGIFYIYLNVNKVLCQVLPDLSCNLENSYPWACLQMCL